VLVDVVVAQVECQGDSFATGIDKQIGETRWRVERPREASWASPVAIRGRQPADDVVLLQSPTALTAHRANSGEQLWAYKAPCDAISSAAAAAGVVYVASRGITALEPSAGAEPKVLWKAANLQPGAASMVVGGDRLYIINQAGVLACAGTADGDIKWRLRLEGEFWGTPVLAGGRMYCVSLAGKIQVVEPAADGRSAKIVGTGQLDGSIQCSPAVVAGALYVRSDGQLWKVAAP
jgi:outer membrane protein assembly factor BamB